MADKRKIESRLGEKGKTRRDFMKFCTIVAGAMGLGPFFGSRIYEAFATRDRPPVFDDLIFDNISLRR